MSIERLLFLGKLLIYELLILLEISHRHMPRLLGKSSKTPLYVGTALVVAIAGAFALEYSGIVDVVPNFGKAQKIIGQSKAPTRKVSNLLGDEF
jgi:hypothetical protein